METRTLATASAVFDALGGVKAVADLTNSTYAAAWNWRKLGNFPPRTYAVLASKLEHEGYTAPLTLWRMPDAEQRAASA